MKTGERWGWRGDKAVHYPVRVSATHLGPIHQTIALISPRPPKATTRRGRSNARRDTQHEARAPPSRLSRRRTHGVPSGPRACAPPGAFVRRAELAGAPRSITRRPLLPRHIVSRNLITGFSADLCVPYAGFMSSHSMSSDSCQHPIPTSTPYDHWPEDNTLYIYSHVYVWIHLFHIPVRFFIYFYLFIYLKFSEFFRFVLFCTKNVIMSTGIIFIW